MKTTGKMKIKNVFFALIAFSLTSVMHTSCSSEEAAKEVVEVVAQTVDGKYRGGWTSTIPTGNVYDNIPISAIILPSAGELYSGEFFYTSSYVSCCGGPTNDGTVTFTLKDSTITDFTYTGALIGCPGKFTGSGKLNSFGRIEIDFIGSDCEGVHTNASLYFNKDIR